MEQKKYLTLVAACAASFTLGAVLFASNGSVPLQGQLVALGDNERVVHTWDRNINDDHYVETHGYAFRPWNDMLYRSVYNSTKSAEYFFRNVEGGEYSVWVTYKKNAGMSYIRTYLADNMPMTVNTGTNSSTDSINMKAHWDEFKGSPNWEDEWVRVGNTFSVNPGNTLTVSFSNARGQGTSYPMLGHVKIIKEGGEGGGGGEGGPFCGDGAVDPDEECDDGNTANGDGCSSTCQAEVDRVAVYLDKDSDGTITGREGYERRHELMHAVNSGSRDTTTYDVNGNGVVGSGDVNAVNTYINARNELAKKVNIRDFLDVDNNLTNGYEVALQMNYLLTSINKGLTAENGDVNGDGSTDQNDFRLITNAINRDTELMLAAEQFRMIDGDSSLSLQISEVVYLARNIRDFDGNGSANEADRTALMSYVQNTGLESLKTSLATFQQFDTNRDWSISTTEIHSLFSSIMQGIENGSKTPTDLRTAINFLNGQNNMY